MIFYTKDECDEWIAGRALQAYDPALVGEYVDYPKDGYRYYNFAMALAGQMFIGDPVLLVLSECGIWSTNENLHMYYRLRQSYHDFRLISEAPGHLFLKHENAEFISFLQISMFNGWGGYIVTQAADFGVFFSHDDYAVPFGRDKASMVEFDACLRPYSK